MIFERVFSLRFFLKIFLLLLVFTLFKGYVAAENFFVDLTSQNPNFKEINYLKEKAIIHGYPDGTFRPDNLVNRAEVLKMIFLARKAKYFTSISASGDVTLIKTFSATDSAKIDFPDVAENLWFFPYVKLAKTEGIIEGNPDGTYSPGRTVNLAEFLKMLFNSDNAALWVYLNKDFYSDVPKRAWFTKYFYYAKFLNILNSDANNNVFPSKMLTRGEIAKILYNYIQALERKREAVSTYYAEDFDGKGTASGEKFDMNSMTAAHKELPFNSFVRIWAKDSDKQIVVRINDRGPYEKGKDFDLSKAAFETLAPLSRGVIKIYWQIISQEDASRF